MGARKIGEIGRDIDVKDSKFERTGAPGIAALVAGIALFETDEDARSALGQRMFGALVRFYRRNEVEGGQDGNTDEPI